MGFGEKPVCPISSLLSPKPAFRFCLQAGVSGHALPALPWGASQIAPNSCQAPSPPAPGQPAGRTRRGQHTLPTRPEINISRETELVLSVFTAKGQAGWWGRGQLEESGPWPTASSPALPHIPFLCARASPSLPLSEPPFQSLKGRLLVEPWPAHKPLPGSACVSSGCTSLVLGCLPVQTRLL